MPLKVKISDFSELDNLRTGDLIPIIRDDGNEGLKNRKVTVSNLEQHIFGGEDGSGIQVSGSSGITGSLSITNDITCSGNLTILGAIVNTLIISSSRVDIGDNKIALNTLYPHERYAGIEVYDSGSTTATASFLWDGSSDTWELSNLSASGYVSASTIRAVTSMTSPIGNFTNLTSSNITASGFVSASTIRAVTSVTSPIGNFTSITASNITASGYVSASVINISPTKFSITDASEYEAGAANSLVIRHTSAGTNYPALFISQSGVTSKVVINGIAPAVYPPGGTAELTVEGEIASTAAIFSSASIAKFGYFNTIEPLSSTFHGLATLNITASNITASGFVSASTIRAVTSVTSPIGNFTSITASNITASGYVSASVINISPTKFSITDASEYEAGAANSLVIRHTSAGTNYPALFISQSGVTSKVVINGIAPAVYPPGGTAELTVEGEIASTAAIFSSASIAKFGYFNTIEPLSSTFHGLATLNITASNITASGFVSAGGDLTASNILINGGSINKVEKFLGLNTSSFGTGILTNERSKTTDDVIYTSASVNYLLHVHHNSASLQIYNLQTQNLVSNVSLTSGKNPNSIYLEGNKAFVGCYGSGSIAIVDISNINSPTTTYASSFGATSYTDDNNFVDPIVFKENFIFGNITSVKIYNTSSVTFVSSTGVGTRISALHAYTSASVDVLLVLGYGSAGSAGTAFLFAYNITTPSAPVLMSQAPVLNTVLQPLPTAAERFCALTVDSENKYAYVGDSTSTYDSAILRVFDLSDLNFIKTIAEVKLNIGYYPFGTPVINRVSLTSYNTVLVTDGNNKRTFEFDLYDIKKQNGQLVVPIKIYTFNDTPTSVKFFKQQLSEDVIVVSTLNGNISFQKKSNKFIINSVNSDGTDSKNSILSLNNFTANISGSLIVSDNINCKTTINASELQFPNHSKIKSDSNYIRTLSSNHVIISEPTLSYNAAFYDYCVYSGSNIRAGVIASAFSAGTVSYNETTTTDIGDTRQLTMSVAVVGDSIQLLSNASTNVSWSIKAIARYI